MVRIELADAEAEARAGTAVSQPLVPPRRSAPVARPWRFPRTVTRLVYVANGRLYVRNLSEPAARAIEGSDAGGAVSARDPFFSPAGRWIGI